MLLCFEILIVKVLLCHNKLLEIIMFVQILQYFLFLKNYFNPF